MTRFNQHILIAAEDESKKRKKDSLGEVFELMKSLTDLQKQIEECLDSQDDVEAREKIQAFDNHIDQMYQTLLELASNGVSAIRKRNNIGDDLPEPESSIPSGNEELLKLPEPSNGLEKVLPPLAPKQIK